MGAAAAGAREVLMIGGTSHVGKSTLARALAATLGWRHVSTDQLARHPGRPWTTTRPHVREHYATLSVAELTARQLEHYRRMWPLVEGLTREAWGPGRGGLVLEGSGVWPELVAELPRARVAALWLTAPDAVLAARVHAESRVDELPAGARLAVRRFLGRTLAYQDLMCVAIDRLGLTRIDTGDTPPAELLARVRRLIDAPRPGAP